MINLFIDVETTSRYNLKTCGAYRYAEGSEILLFGFAFDDEPVAVVEISENSGLSDRVISAISDPAVVKIAHNAAFERVILAQYLGKPMPPEQWRCTMSWGRFAGLPGSLDEACKRAGIAGKLDGGKRLITKFCTKQAEREGDDWELFKDYNRQDVEIERALYAWLQDYPMPDKEWRIWEIDQSINDRGFLVDESFVTAAIAMSEANRAALMDEARRISGLVNPNSLTQLRNFLGDPLGSLDKAAVKSLLNTETEPVRRRMLEIRQTLALASVKKFQALKQALCNDGRVRGTMMYYGAHTGRWSGRLFQPQNLPRAKCVDTPFARELVKNGDSEQISLYFGDIEQCLSTLIRSAVVAPPRGVLRVDDYSAIEARVCAWLAGEKWILDVFLAGAPYYEETASRMFHVPVDQITKELRQKGKIASLALQYQGSVGALHAMGADMPESEMLDLVQLWRTTCPAIVQYWWNLNEAALDVVTQGWPVSVGKLTFSTIKNDMYITLPSGRYLIYKSVQMTDSERTGARAVSYQQSERNVGVRTTLYGGMICENVVQAIARDLLAEHLMNCHASCVLHVHDEVILENATCELKPVAWATGLPLKLEGFESQYYKKE